MTTQTPDTAEPETLRFGYGDTALGTIVVARSVHGIAAALVDAPHIGIDLTLDLRGSPVEGAVWNALQAIPAGEIRTYGAIAQGLPMTVTAQEVGAACAANRVAVVVPCHRVVKSDCSISRYRWGVQGKRRLINMEGVA
jgi:AraC family transcriptional regulator, regulatory protein of adaptative response / methylated-DNA-[protein]-cysteine methyltransferase